MSMSEKELAVIRERADMATEGPWERRSDHSVGRFERMEDNFHTTVVYGPAYAHDSDFIADARENVPKLLDEVYSLRDEVSELRAERDELLAASGTSDGANAKLQAVKRLCQDTDDDWLDSEDTSNTVGDIRQAIEGYSEGKVVENLDVAESDVLSFRWVAENGLRALNRAQELDPQEGYDVVTYVGSLEEEVLRLRGKVD